MRVRIPESITLSGRVIKVRMDGWDCQGRNELGYSRYVQGWEIVLDGAEVPEQTQETFLHECAHFIDHLYGTRLTESQVMRLAHGLYDLIRQLEPMPIPTCRDGHSTEYMPVGESEAG